MPLYEYTCDSCKRKLEAHRTMDNRDNAPACPKCSQPMRRLMTAGMATLWAGKFQGRSLKKLDTDGLGSEW